MIVEMKAANANERLILIKSRATRPDANVISINTYL